jgi:hypothetical protein
MRSVHEGDLVCGEDSTRTFRVMGVIGRFVALRQTTKDGLLIDRRTAPHHTTVDHVRHICRVCRGFHHTQECPQIRARLR